MQEDSDDEPMNVDHAHVKMVVVDGIVMGPTHCAYGDCTSALGNAQGGFVLCMKLDMEQSDISRVVQIQRRLEH